MFYCTLLNAQVDTVSFPTADYRLPSMDNQLLIRSEKVNVNFNKGVPEIKIPLYTLNSQGVILTNLLRI